MTEDATGIVNAYVVPPDGAAAALDWEGVAAWRPEHGLLWLHLDVKDETAQRWIREQSGLDRATSAALLADETRPRAFQTASGFGVILRGVNLNPGANPEDMVSLRLHVDGHRVISARIRRLFAVQDMAERIEAGNGPRTSCGFLASIAEMLTSRMAPPIEAMDEEISEAEVDLTAENHREIRTRLKEARRAAIVLRRYISPQRDVMRRLQQDAIPGATPETAVRFREVEDRLIRYVEDLEEIREKAAVLQDEVANHLAEESNRRMYALTIIVAIMLPLSFVTGLFGINVAGMPGVESKSSFWILCAILVVMAAGQIWLFRRLRWI